MTFLYIGLVIGAGFASGREILEFFNLKNREDFTGIILAGIIFSFVAYIILIKSKEYGIENFYEFTDIVSDKAGCFIKRFMFLYMFAGFFVMISAGGTLFSYTFEFDKKTGVLLMSLVCFIVLLFDMKGIELLNTILVPLMIAGIIYICLCGIFYETVATFSTFEKMKNNFLISAVCYVSYNTINAGAIMVPCSAKMSVKEIKISTALSGLILGVLIFIIWLTQNVYFDNIYMSEFPMLYIAGSKGDIYKNIYSSVLFMSICTTAVSCGYGVLSAFILNRKIKKILTVLVLCLCAIPLSFFEFSSLVSNVYSMFGYVGIIWMIMLFKSFIK